MVHVKIYTLIIKENELHMYCFVHVTVKIGTERRRGSRAEDRIKHISHVRVYMHLYDDSNS